jgi:hypothetical protein
LFTVRVTVTGLLKVPPLGEAVVIGGVLPSSSEYSDAVARINPDRANNRMLFLMHAPYKNRVSGWVLVLIA